MEAPSTPTYEVQPQLDVNNSEEQKDEAKNDDEPEIGDGLRDRLNTSDYEDDFDSLLEQEIVDSPAKDEELSEPKSEEDLSEQEQVVQESKLGLTK